MKEYKAYYFQKRRENLPPLNREWLRQFLMNLSFLVSLLSLLIVLSASGVFALKALTDRDVYYVTNTGEFTKIQLSDNAQTAINKALSLNKKTGGNE
ncbi:conserved hypothetical protein [Vibrio chagasii]|nr:hypothetical protein AOG25_08655 [Vibrio alginolyticus]CAH7146249.1 conserved hypothetical protein [Vibrio chagasii]CAH7317169.1 conserved hypothetical protein [Vibrio chagasii]